MPLVLSPFTSRDYKLVNNVFLLKCERKEESAVSKLRVQIFYFFFPFTNEQFINTGASGKSKQVGQPAEKKLCVAIHYVLPESGLLRLCY